MSSSESNVPKIAGTSSCAVLPTPPRIDLKTIDDVRVEMARVYRDMRAARIDTQDGTRLSYVLAQLGKLIELADLEQRIAQLENTRHESKVAG